MTDHFEQHIIAEEYLYLTATTSIKISVLIFYRRLTIKLSGRFTIAIWAGIIYNFCYWVDFMLAVTLACIPTQAFWMEFDLAWETTHRFSCRSERVALPASAIFSTIGDLYATVIPMLQIWHMTLPRRQKLALYPLFGLGFLYV